MNTSTNSPLKIPVALAMWNQVTAEVILLIRTYAFFNRNIYILVFLVSALAGVVAYQLYVATSQMLRESVPVPSSLPCRCETHPSAIVLPFIPLDVSPRGTWTGEMMV